MKRSFAISFATLILFTIQPYPAFADCVPNWQTYCQSGADCVLKTPSVLQGLDSIFVYLDEQYPSSWKEDPTVIPAAFDRKNIESLLLKEARKEFRDCIGNPEKKIRVAEKREDVEDPDVLTIYASVKLTLNPQTRQHDTIVFSVSMYRPTSWLKHDRGTGITGISRTFAEPISSSLPEEEMATRVKRVINSLEIPMEWK